MKVGEVSGNQETKPASLGGRPSRQKRGTSKKTQR